MTTEKLYQLDSYLREFTATITERSRIDDKPAVALDRTAFYPTSGGQMNDTGEINGTPVNGVLVEDGKIWHLLGKPLETDIVHGKINWERRFDFMQQHSGFHVLAQSFLRELDAETLSSHLGEKYSTIDVNLVKISADEIARVEELANRVIWENRVIKAYFVSKDELENLNVRKFSEIFDPVRLVDIQDFDLDPCGGTHVKNTGEIGIVKILFYEKIRGYLRFTFVAGNRALREFQEQTRILAEVSSSLSTGREEFVASIEKMKSDQSILFKKNKKLEDEILSIVIRELKGEANRAKIVSKIYPDLNANSIRKIASIVSREAEGTFLLASAGEPPFLVFSTSLETLDLRPVLNQALIHIDGKGGGRANFVQGGGKNKQGLQAAVETAKKLIKEKLENS
ncbi:MAG: hypothetical protein GWP06_11600 [Actinobacteria bacterium]|nr:hypothetical protein [Actinomycetota bacterium]